MLDAKKNNGNIEETQNLSEKAPIEIIRLLAESQCARLQLIIKWLCWVIVILIACNIGQFVAHEIERSKYETVAIEAELRTEGGGNANFVGKDGDITNGSDKSKNDMA